MSAAKSMTERVLQAIGFEFFAILICTPLFAWVMGISLVNMGVVTVATCLIALGWNVLFNALFDRLCVRYALPQSGWTRLLHALLFEGGLIVVSVPLVAWWLNMSLVQALWLDIGVLLFFLPYTYVYHWAYDALRPRFLRAPAAV